MSLHLKFTRADGSELGTIDDVRQAIADVIPDVRVFQQPGGQRKIAEIESRSISLPQALREVFEKMPSITVAEYGNAREPLLRFLLGPGENLRYLQVEVKGDAAAAEVILDRLAQSAGWLVSEFSPSDAKGSWDELK